MRNNKDNIKFTVILIGGIIDFGLLFTSIGMWLWSIFGCSIFSEEERRASAELSDMAGNLFLAFLLFNIVFGIIVNILMADEKKTIKTTNIHKHPKRVYFHQPFCEECGCPDVTVYSDGMCECNGCGYIWRG